ncbi:hypothetical protein BAMA_23255 [Bacillus manliponensis]|uniref:Uncharacterized protein n=1 Tax=Bacillus manliponensis TaxID=574376 RepID=A0A073JYL4_9BACI|nr:hypothetical protein [Bacillus manliponensis]KEK19297.1 hypothetical protein BAMA_23255 [Bacillus manliponensis]
MLLSLKIKKLCAAMQDNNFNIRYQAMLDLHNIEENTLSIPILVQLIEAACESYPKPFNEQDDPSFCIMSFVNKYANESMIAPIQQHFSNFSPRAKEVTFETLLNIDDYKGIPVFLQLARSCDEHVTVPFWLLEDIDGIGKYIFPELLQLLLHKQYNLTLSDQALLQHTVLAKAETLYKSYGLYEKEYSLEKAYQQWSDMYLPLRSELSMYCGVMGFLQDSQTKHFLNQLLLAKDDWIACSALISLTRRGVEAGPTIYETYAKSSETRSFLLVQLQLMEQEDLFPSLYKTQHQLVLGQIEEMLLEGKFKHLPNKHTLWTECEREDEDGTNWIYYVTKFTSDHLPWKEQGELTAVARVQKEKMKSGFTAEIEAFTGYEKANAYEIEEHIERAIEFGSNDDELAMISEETIYEFSPSFHYMRLISSILLTGFAIFHVKDKSFIEILLIATFITVLVWIIQKNYREVRATSVQLKRGSIEYVTMYNAWKVNISEIAFVNCERRKFQKGERLEKLRSSGDYIVLSNAQQEELLAIPVDSFDEDLFFNWIEHIVPHASVKITSKRIKTKIL